MKQESESGFRIADERTASGGAAAEPAKSSNHPRRRGTPRSEALAGIREMLAEIAEDAAYVGIDECVRLIAAADLAVAGALAGRGRPRAAGRRPRA